MIDIFRPNEVRHTFNMSCYDYLLNGTRSRTWIDKIAKQIIIKLSSPLHLTKALVPMIYGFLAQYETDVQ